MDINELFPGPPMTVTYSQHLPLATNNPKSANTILFIALALVVGVGTVLYLKNRQEEL